LQQQPFIDLINDTNNTIDYEPCRYGIRFGINPSRFKQDKLVVDRTTNNVLLINNNQHHYQYQQQQQQLTNISCRQLRIVTANNHDSMSIVELRADAQQRHAPIIDVALHNLCRAIIGSDGCVRTIANLIHDVRCVYFVVDQSLVELAIRRICVDEVNASFQRKSKSLLYSWIADRLRQHLETNDRACVSTFRQRGVPEEVCSLVALRRRHTLDIVKTSHLHKRLRSLHRTVDRQSRFVSSKPGFSFADLEATPVALDQFEFVWKLLRQSARFGPTCRINKNSPTNVELRQLCNIWQPTTDQNDHTTLDCAAAITCNCHHRKQ
jgi:hypothetical protein